MQWECFPHRTIRIICRYSPFSYTSTFCTSEMIYVSKKYVNHYYAMIGFTSEEMCTRNVSHISSLKFFHCYTVTNSALTSC